MLFKLTHMPYPILILPLLSLLITQTIKSIIKSNHQKFSFHNLMAYSGMPSGHSALVVSLTTIIGLAEGISSPLFALSFVLSTIVIRDALGIRRYLGQHGQILNILVNDLKNDHVLDQTYPHLLENIGHNPYQVIVGASIGFSISLIGYLIFF